MKSLEPDVIVVIAYGKILPKPVLDIPKFGCINIHGSLLPKLRGAAPIQRAVIDGEEETGVTSMMMDVGLDTGDMLVKESVKIMPDETAGELFDRLSVLGAEAMLEAIDALKAGSLTPTPQNHAAATSVGLLTKEMGEIDWSAPAAEIHNRIRGLYSWPGAYTSLHGKRLKLHRARLSSASSDSTPGTVHVKGGKLLSVCGDGNCIELLEVQPEGKKRMDAAAFLNGRGVADGDQFE